MLSILSLVEMSKTVESNLNISKGQLNFMIVLSESPLMLPGQIEKLNRDPDCHA